jgi:hypothetical protein
MKQKNFTLCSLLFFMYSFCHAQKAISGDFVLDSATDYTVFDVTGRRAFEGFGSIVSFKHLPNGIYVLVGHQKSFTVVIQHGDVIGFKEYEYDSGVPENANQICITGSATARPFSDIALLKQYIQNRIDQFSTDSAKVCELTRFATEWYPHALHASWVTQSWFYSTDDVFKHFLQVDSMGVCGDQAVYLSHFIRYFLGLRSCAIGMAHSNEDSAGILFSHVQCLVEIPVSDHDTLWAIFDSQNGVAYRDTAGQLIDFRDIVKKKKVPVADEMKPVSHSYATWMCQDRDYSTLFPFTSLALKRSYFHPLDSIEVLGERTLSFVFGEMHFETDQQWRIVARSHGFDAESLSAKQLSDYSPCFTTHIWDVTNDGPTGVPENIAFAHEVRAYTGIP